MQINRIWMGSPMPSNFKKYGEQWLELNPGYMLHDWTEEEIMDNKWLNQDVLDHMYHQSQQPGADKIAYYTHVADVVDYELVYSCGGWYFNTDLKPLKPLYSIKNFNDKLPAFALEDDVHPVNMAMYSPKRHIFLRHIINTLPRRYFGMPGAFMNATTGVQLIQEAYRTYPWQWDIQFFNRRMFNPIHFTDFGYGEEPDIEREYPEETIAVHLWGHRTNQRAQRILG